jgi:hypothetical protein
MDLEERLAEIERQLLHLRDREEILDCIVRTSRGNDRPAVFVSSCAAIQCRSVHELRYCCAPLTASSRTGPTRPEQRKGASAR